MGGVGVDLELVAHRRAVGGEALSLDAVAVPLEPSLCQTTTKPPSARVAIAGRQLELDNGANSA